MALRIEKYVNGAYGLAHDGDGRVHLVANALPGELVEEKDAHAKGSAIISSCAGVLEESPVRRKPSCPLYGICGGCDFLIVDEEDSAKFKQQAVLDNLGRIAGLDAASVFAPPVSGPFKGYRSRCRVHVDPRGGRAGFLARSSNGLVEVCSCPALAGKLDRFLSEDRKMLLGRARALMIEKGLNRNTGCVEIPMQEGSDGVSFGHGRVSALGYTVCADVFFQSNLRLLPQLLSFVHESTVGEVVMDLYSGVGTFSRLFEGEGRTVYAVERQKECLALSRINAPSAHSFTDDASAFARKVSSRVDTVIVDPPRVGLAKDVPGLISGLRPSRIVYVSCDSITASRDLAAFSKDYGIVFARLFDFYPGSSHEETVFVLDRF